MEKESKYYKMKRRGIIKVVFMRGRDYSTTNEDIERMFRIRRLPYRVFDSADRNGPVVEIEKLSEGLLKYGGYSDIESNFFNYIDAEEAFLWKEY